MKIAKNLIFLSSLLLLLSSCDEKKLIEVQVPLPSGPEKKKLGNPDDVKADIGSFQLVQLPYSYDAFEPELDATTMELHYSRHYLSYANHLNKELKGTPIEKFRIEEIISSIDMNNIALRENAGGYYNHSLYFESITPKNGGQPSAALTEAIVRDFGSFENFRSLFTAAAQKIVGSGWAWLVIDKAGVLQIATTANQDNPMMPQSIIRGTPLLPIDVWEHAYYLNFHTKRKKYIDTYFDSISWAKISERYNTALGI